MTTTIHFYIRYSTRFGQNLRLVGNCPELGDGQIEKSVYMDYVSHELWRCSVSIEHPKIASLIYAYVLEENSELQREWGNDRFLELQGKNVATLDVWSKGNEVENTFMTAPFDHVFFPKNAGKSLKIKEKRKKTHEFRVKAPRVGKDEVLVLLGNDKALGNWNTDSPKVKMKLNGNWWTTEVDLEKAHFPLAYKYGVWNETEGRFVGFESGENRLLFSKDAQDELLVVHDGFARLENGQWRGAGIAVPVFALRSEKSFGVGEFTDLPKLADWAVSVGLKMVQILPINDTSAKNRFTDSYPYAAISAFALHPLYLNIEVMAGAKNAAAIKSVLKKQKALNALPLVDYVETLAAKWDAAKAIYKKEKDHFRKEAEFQFFFENNKHWLLPYAAFCFFKDKNGTTEFGKWKTNSVYDAAEIEQLNQPKSKAYDEIGLHLFVQYHLHLQLKAAVDYCHKVGVAVKGDIPIGIYRYSADAWTAPELYNMTWQTGAPPDAFGPEGQNWGFPTYNWEVMKSDGFAWWRQRFEQMSNYFDAFRIDHILGFFRIWSIPMHAVQGILGKFVPAMPVHVHEFFQNGVNFQFDRLVKPYITDHTLYEDFGQQMEAVKSQFLEPWHRGTYRFKAEFDTQRKVEAYFQGKNAEEAFLKKLYSLHSNVILIEEDDSDGHAYHFRILMHDTSSFKHLDGHTKSRLDALYRDYLNNRQDELWRKEALEKLPALKAATEMLICGEDLGMIPNCVEEVMERLAILTLEIFHMPKKWVGADFMHPKLAPYLSVLTPSTHDMETMRLWWEKDRAVTQQFYNKILGQWGEAPQELSPALAQMIVAQHLWSPAMWSIFQLQDLFAMQKSLWQPNIEDERINVPANPEHYWRYRMPMTLEALQNDGSFNELLGRMVLESGR